MKTTAKRLVALLGMLGKAKLEHVITTGKIIGKRFTGIQLRKFTVQIREWTAIPSNSAVFTIAKK